MESRFFVGFCRMFSAETLRLMLFGGAGLGVAIILGFAPLWLSGIAGALVILGPPLSSYERGAWSFSSREARREQTRLHARREPALRLPQQHPSLRLPPFREAAE